MVELHAHLLPGGDDGQSGQGSEQLQGDRAGETSRIGPGHEKEGIPGYGDRRRRSPGSTFVLDQSDLLERSS